VAYVVRDKIQFLSEASKILSSTLDYNVTLVSVAKLVVEGIADFCIIDIAEGEKMERVVVRTSRKSDQRLANKMFNFQPDPKNKFAIYDAANTGSSILIEKVTKKWLKTISRIQEEQEIVEKLELKSFIFTPLISRGKIIGVLTVGSSRQGFSYTVDDVLFVDELAGRAALAVDNSRLFSEAQQAIQTRDEFMSIASHELKTPLTSILLTLQFAHRRLLKQDAHKNVLNAIETGILQTRRLSGLMNDLLNISVISTGRLKIQKEETELIGLLNDVILWFELQAKNSGVKIIFKIKRKKIWGFWDKVRLEEVFSNLISNAIKYGNNKPVTIEVSLKENMAVIKISDEGIGIEAEEIEKIFGLFRRTVAAREFKGMGVGLYISYQVVKAHKGTMSVESTPGKGSMFVVKLPLRF